MNAKQIGNLIVFSSGNESLYLEVVGKDLLRFSSHPFKKGKVALTSSFSPISYSVDKNAEGYSLIVGHYSVTISQDLAFSISRNGKEIIRETHVNQNEKIDDEIYPSVRYFSIPEDEHFFGLGDHPGPLNRRGYRFVNWNSDVPEAHEETMKSLYKSFPVYYGLGNDSCYGVFIDDPSKTIFDFGRDGQESFFSCLDGGDAFYLALGESLKEVIAIFSKLIGVYPLPPRWSLGYGQCRWSYMSEAEAEEVLAKYKEADIPLSTLYLDIDYMDGYRVFTTDDKRFPNFKKWVSSLHTRGYKLITIIDPGVKVDKEYKIYSEGLSKDCFATYKGKVYENEVWPGLSVYPCFNDKKVRDWWGRNLKFLLNLGVDGIWDDMNEPASFKGPLPLGVEFHKEKHSEIHNLYGYYMSEATFEGLRKYQPSKRPFLITRAAFAGIERYSSVWTGDNQSLWSHLRMALPQQMNIGLSLEPFVGTDIGGFGGDCPAELMSRWIEVGMFSPLMRNHSAMGTKRQEPYRYDKKTQDIYRKWVKNRYRFLPYIYDAFYFHAMDGLPLIRPLALDYPSDAMLIDDATEFGFGEQLLVAPILDPGANGRAVRFPSGQRFYDFFHPDISFDGGSLKAVEMPLSSCGIYAKEGAVIPLSPEGYYDASKASDTLVVKLFPGEGKALHYQDAGDGYGYQNGEYNLYEFTNHDGLLSVKILHKGYPLYREIKAISLSGVTSLRF